MMKPWIQTGSALACLTIMMAGGCSSLPPANIVHNVVVVNRNGHPVDLLQDAHVMAAFEFRKATSNIVQSIQTWHDQNPAINTNIMIFVHGGLNGWKSSLARASKYTATIKEDGTYPIFVNWDSSLASCYVEHLLFMRQGRKWPLWGPMTAPFVLAADAGRSVTRSPMTLWNDANVWARGWNEAVSTRYKEASLTNRAIVAGVIRNIEANPLDESSFGLKRDSFHLCALPLGLLTMPLLADTIGTGSWDSMRRRTQMMFNPDYDKALDGMADSATFTPEAFPGGAMCALAEAMIQLQSNGTWATLDVVGHSMGAIVASRLISQYGNRTNGSLRISNITFMAAACTVNDVISDVLPYLDSHPRARFYNLMLHPRCDAGESMGYSLLGNGSLLEQIDELYTSPDTPFERTMGKWENAMLCATALSRCASRPHQIFFKTFPYAAAGKPYPQQHGDFDDVGAFWRHSWWDPRVFVPAR